MYAIRSYYDNPKAFGQDLYLFGKKKGTGETVWEIKDKIGYYTSSMMDLFSVRHTVENMIVSGFMDSIGLYKVPSEMQLRVITSYSIHYTKLYDLSRTA